MFSCLVKAKAAKILGFLRRNLSHCSSKVKEQAYNSLVRLRVAYATPVWPPTHRIHRGSKTQCPDTAEYQKWEKPLDGRHLSAGDI